MSLHSLEPAEREIVRRSLEVTFLFFDEDFHTRLGVDAATMRALLEAWPHIDDAEDESDACIAVNNSLNDLLHGIGLSDAQTRALVGATRDEMARVYHKWARARGWQVTGVR
jgi:hypothetical protein